jgi:hypothetical protein
MTDVPGTLERVLKNSIIWDITLRRNMSPPSSGSKNKLSKKPAGLLLVICVHASFLLGLFVPEDGGDIFLRNVTSFSTDCMALYPRR